MSEELYENYGAAKPRATRYAGNYAPQSPTPSKKEALDDFLTDYHKEKHTGFYFACDGCTQVWMFFTDNPSFYQHL